MERWSCEGRSHLVFSLAVVVAGTGANEFDIVNSKSMFSVTLVDCLTELLVGFVYVHLPP